ncbi:hypothetical protein CC1G_04264 [Coprinopsis cinerea okayama7|uniref:Uncharacterized protein n=1 Tax=Coprinopsis cinerea (strain Okayama-7 / 130 / ATCC MYA-4618 / FGSC 9003) TaxID=240176 RepID=A8NFH4_COPC7|nr:hypothetical protein CC1G_04264 [Coprinopsis cinerea okayama7\|eukprot:XP_001833285.2 hypothetical protein CC1G_04264 [Coprinopsis cinerea okayama7\
MEAALPLSPTRSMLGDDEQYNTEGARLFFGPLKTPERRMNSMQDTMSQQQDSEPQVAGPSNSEPDDLSPSQASPTATEDASEALLVEELVKEVEDDDNEEEESGGDEGKDNLDYFPDEPSFVLAEKISRATDNPSPPPSPLAPMSIFGDVTPFTFTAPIPTAEEVEEPPTSQPTPSDDEPSPQSSRHSASPPIEDAMDLDPPTAATLDASPQPNLINLDTVIESEPVASVTDNVPDSAVSAVDELLLDAPVSVSSASSPVGDSSDASHPAVEDATSSVEPPVSQPLIQHSLGNSQVDPSTPPAKASATHLSPGATPVLRRSPRRSVAAPTPSQAPQLVVPLPTRDQPTPRSQKARRKKELESEVVEDSQGEDDSNTAAAKPTLALQPDIPRGRRSKSPLIFNREVGSLSPKTSDLLHQLIPALADPTPLELDTAPDAPQTTELAATEARPPVFFPPPSDSSIATPKRPQPARPFLVASPSKPLLSSSQPANVPATPARRITMEEAIEKGQLSPAKAAQMGYTPRVATASTAPGNAIPATPARRVLITDKAAPSSSKATLRFGSPVRAKSKGPEEELAQDVPMSDATSSSMAKLAVQGSSTAPHRAGASTGGRISRLPFPLTGSKPPSASGSRPAIGKPTESSRSVSALQSPAKSALKQSTSRIPRIPAKPYARPAIPKPTTSVAKPPAVEKPATIRKVDLTKPSTTKMVIPGSSTAVDSLAKGKGKATSSTTRPVAAKAAAAEKSAVLKRKRVPEPLASPVKQKPLRLVPSVLVPPTSSAIRALRATAKTSKTAATSAMRPQRTREPPSRTAAAAAAAKIAASIACLPPDPPASSPPQPIAPPAEVPVAQGPVVVPDAEKADPSNNTPLPDSLGSPMQAEAPSPFRNDAPSPAELQPASSTPEQPAPLPIIQIDPPHETPPIETLPPFVTVELPVPQGVRRTGRIRKPTQVAAEASAAEPSKPVSRRKAATQNIRFTFTDAYSEMSATALKSLTAANTVRNQAYLSVKLETAIIRKDGARPESPAVKIKTIAQREEEEKQKLKMERAQRYARRSGGSIPGSSDVEPDSEDDALPGASSMDVSPARHQRGAGEDEDYETPHRAFKRMRLTENGVEEEEEEEKRRVKWDRRLFSVTFLDEIKLGSRPYPKKITTQLKGCLAPAAKQLPLDTLGNLPEDKAPLVDLPSENVIVKKFVYDSDVLEPEPVDPPPPPPPKVTRSRNKKAKS